MRRVEIFLALILLAVPIRQKTANEGKHTPLMCGPTRVVWQVSVDGIVPAVSSPDRNDREAHRQLSHLDYWDRGGLYNDMLVLGIHAG